MKFVVGEQLFYRLGHSRGLMLDQQAVHSILNRLPNSTFSHCYDRKPASIGFQGSVSEWFQSGSVHHHAGLIQKFNQFSVGDAIFQFKLHAAPFSQITDPAEIRWENHITNEHELWTARC